MERPVIRIATLKDINTLIEWRMRVLADVFADSPENNSAALISANKNYYLTHIADGSHIACFAETGGSIIGCGGLCFQNELPSPDNPSGLNAYLMNIYTLPAYRGKGVAGATVSYLLGAAKARGTQKIYLETTAMGKTLYTELGFNPISGYMIYSVNENSLNAF